MKRWIGLAITTGALLFATQADAAWILWEGSGTYFPLGGYETLHECRTALLQMVAEDIKEYGSCNKQRETFSFYSMVCGKSLTLEYQCVPDTISIK